MSTPIETNIEEPREVIQQVYIASQLQFET